MTVKFSKFIAFAFALPAMIGAGATSAYGADIAYAWANRPASATYTPDSNYVFNNGQPVQISRQSLGRYSVAFGRVAGPGANVQVQLYGADAGYCNAQSWNNGSVNVRCYNVAGAAADRRFVVLAIKAAAGEEAQIAYAWLNNASAASYSADASYRFGPGDMNVTRTTAGNYKVNLATNVRNRRISLATGYATTARCNVTLNTRGRVQVTCINPSETLVDARASVLLLREGVPRMSLAFNVAMDGELGAEYGLSSDGSAQSVQRISQGRYRVVIGPEANPGGHVQVAAILTRAHCWPESWGGGAVTVRCARNGALTDAGFGVVALARGGALTPTIVVPRPVEPNPALPQVGPAIVAPQPTTPTITLPSGPVILGAPGGVIIDPGVLMPRRVEVEAYAPSRSGPRASVAYKLAGKGQTVNINYEIIDGLAVTEGDIILGRHDEMMSASAERRSCRGEICSVQSPLIRRSGENYLWPGGVIPYEIDSAYPADERQAILDGIALIDGPTNLILKPRAGESDFVRVNRVDEGCSSDVGRQGDDQDINIKGWDTSGWCPPGSIAHEFLHAAGIWHEQSREDRNSFVRILRDNIISDRRGNFDQHISDGVDIANYDYGSVMHYGRTAFGKDNPDGTKMTTIEVLTPGAAIGQRAALSPLDVSGVNGLYANEDCVYFNPDRVSVSRQGGAWRLDERLADGRTHQIIPAGDNRREADMTLALVRHYRLDQVCFVGRPDPSAMYFLSAGSAPAGAYGGEDCAPINPAGSRVVKDNGKWKIVEDRPDGRYSYAVFPNPGEAYRTLDIWRQRDFRFSCYVGRPDPAVSYYRR
jgi:Astacin (Peptidase family M12A)